MNSPRNHQPQSAGQAEETLRLIAGLPAPENLASRIQAGLHSASRTAPRNASLLHWPISLTRNNWMQSTAMRSAAAAAIVCVVAGGGWRIYSRVQPPAAPTAKVTAMPARVPNSGGFSSANAIHTPDTLNGPVITHAVKPADKSRTQSAATTPSGAQSNAAPNAVRKKKKSAAKPIPEPTP
jgi:hypothetical protein